MNELTESPKIPQIINIASFFVPFSQLNAARIWFDLITFLSLLPSLPSFLHSKHV